MDLDIWTVRPLYSCASIGDDARWGVRLAAYVYGGPQDGHHLDMHFSIEDAEGLVGKLQADIERAKELKGKL